MYKKFEKILCSVCSSNEFEKISEKGHLNIPIYVSICKKCGLVFLNPRWTKKEYADYYHDKYDKWLREIIEEIPDKLKYLKPATAFKRITPYLSKKNLKILDIGAGMGWHSYYFKKKYKNISLSAIESSLRCSNYLKKNGFKILTSDIDSNWHIENKNNFNLIILRMTLEHLLNPVSALQKISDSLSNNGILYISVPNMMIPKMKGSLENHWFRAEHTYYFSKTTLLSMVSKANLKPIFINSDTSELWGIFKGGGFDFKFNSVYEEQINAIKKFRKKYLINYIINYIPRKIKSILPDKIKQKLKIILKNA